MQPKYPCDMHCHTTRSDGRDDPLTLIGKAAALGMRVLGITDHDITPPLTLTTADGREVDTVAWAASLGLTLVPGYEFSCDTLVDEVHICGYGLDWEHPGLHKEVSLAARSKTDAYRELCERLTAAGMPLDWEMDVLCCRDAAGGMQRRAPEAVQRKHIFEAMAERGYAETWAAAKLRVRDDAALNVRRRKIDPQDAIALIHRCGGVAVLAHPYLIDETVTAPGKGTLTRAAYIERLIEAGLDGIEASYTYDKTTYRGGLTPEEIEAEVRARYADRLPILSGGSDYHGAAPSGKQRFIGERGITLAEYESAWRILRDHSTVTRREDHD